MEIAFQDSACGSLEMERRAGAAAFDGPVFSLSLALSMGDIAGEPFGPERREMLAKLFAVFPQGEEAAAELLQRGERDFHALLHRVKQGEDMRIWYSDQPDERCGLCWLMAALEGVKPRGTIRLVKLSDWEVDTDGTAVQKTGWGEVEPGQWAAHLVGQTPLPGAVGSALARQWERLRRENAPLRAVVNGRLCSVAEDFYDGFIRRELAAQPEEFQQAIVVGRVLGRCQLGISDAWIALRMEEMIHSGQLRPVSDPPADGPRYHRLLRKVRQC